MYLQALYRDSRNSAISLLIEIDSWASAGAKLPDLYSAEGYTLFTLQYINFLVDPWDTNLPLYACRIQNPEDGTVSTSYIFASSVEEAVMIITQKFKQKPISVSLTSLTYRNENKG